MTYKVRGSRAQEVLPGSLRWSGECPLLKTWQERGSHDTFDLVRVFVL